MSGEIASEIRLPSALASQIDEWRRNMPDLPNRAEAARQLIERGLTPPAVAPAPEKTHAPAVPAAPETVARCQWLSRECRDVGTKAMNVRIADRVELHVGFLADQMEITKRQFVEDVLRETCAQELAKLGIPA